MNEYIINVIIDEFQHITRSEINEEELKDKAGKIAKSIIEEMTDYINNFTSEGE